MVLVRLAYTADLPTPADLMRRLGDASGPGGERTGGSIPAAPAQQKPVHAAIPEPPPLPAPVVKAEATDAAPPRANPPADPLADPKSFDELVALAEQKRDLKLKHALTEQVQLVRFRPGHLEINPLGSAPKEFGQELMRKLKTWTGRVWIVAVSGEEGAAPLGAQRRAREAREIEQIREHPQVKQVLQRFPGARIATVRPAVTDDATPEAPEPDSDEFKEDGTNP
jgi:DNA polymerase III subunit gamma/tau